MPHRLINYCIMRKSKFVPAILAALLFVAGYGGYEAYQSYASTNSQTLLEQNVEALSQNEGGSSETWDCWSQLEKGTGITWLCGEPCVPYKKYKGTSGRSKCVKN